MNIVHLIMLSIFELGLIYVYVNNLVINYVHPKFTYFILGGIIITGLLLMISIIKSFIDDKIKLHFKIDYSLILLLPVMIFTVTKPYFKTDEFITNKFKGVVSFRQFEEAKRNLGYRNNESRPLIPALTDKNHKSENRIIKYHRFNILHIYRLIHTLDSMLEIEKNTFNIETIGQIYSIKDYDFFDLSKEDFKLVRMIMVCCIADMQPMGIIVKNINNYKFEINDWVKVRGELYFTSDKVAGSYMGILTPTEIIEIEPPDPIWVYIDFLPVEYEN